MEMMEELDDEPQFTEMKTLIARLSNSKASGRDAIPADLIKAGRQVLLSPLYSLLLKCWRERIVPQEIRDSNRITLYKNNGDRGDCNSYRDIYLLRNCREALFTILKKVGCPPILLDLTKSFHENMQGTAQVDGMISY